MAMRMIVSGNEIVKRKLSLLKMAVIEMNKDNCLLFENAVYVSVNISKTMIMGNLKLNKKIKSINNSSYYSMGMEENNSMGIGNSMNPIANMNASASMNPIASAHKKGSNIYTRTGSHHCHSQINNTNCNWFDYD